MDKFRFIRLEAHLGEKHHPIWFRIDLITRICIGFDGRTHLDYAETGIGNEPTVYRVKETPEEIIALIEKQNG
jgi:hypothetical protein